MGINRHPEVTWEVGATEGPPPTYPGLRNLGRKHCYTRVLYHSMFSVLLFLTTSSK